MEELSQRHLATLLIESVAERIRPWMASLPLYPQESLPSPAAGLEEMARYDALLHSEHTARSSIEQEAKSQGDGLVRPLHALAAVAMLDAAVAYCETEAPHLAPPADTSLLAQRRVSAVAHSAQGRCTSAPPPAARDSFMSQHLLTRAKSLTL